MAQHRDDGVDKVDRRGDAAGDNHQQCQRAVALKVEAVHKAHDGDAGACHKCSARAGNNHDQCHNGNNNQVKAATLARIRPNTRQAQELRFIDKSNAQQNRLRRKEQGIKVQLIFVGQCAFHHELGHALDKVEQEQCAKERGTLDKQAGDLAQAHAARFFGLEQGERSGDQHEGGNRGDAHGHGRDGHAAREEQRQAKDHDDADGAQRLAHAGQIELVGLLQAAFVYVGDAVDHFIEVDAQANRGHLRVVAAGAAVYQTACQRERSAKPAVELVGGEGRFLVDVRDLKIAHTVVARDHDERAGDKGDGELAGFLGAHELRGHDGEQGKRHAPHGGAQGVPQVVSAGGVLLVLGFLRGEAAAVDGCEQAVPPGVDHATDGARLAVALTATARGLAAVGTAGVALAQLLDASELLGGVRGGKQAVLDASALTVRPAARYGGVGDAVAAGYDTADAIEGRDAQGGSFLLLRLSIVATVSVRVFEQIVQYIRQAAAICR